MGEVVTLPLHHIEQAPPRVIERAGVNDLEEVVIIGYSRATEFGPSGFYLDFSHDHLSSVLLMLERARMEVMRAYMDQEAK